MTVPTVAPGPGQVLIHVLWTSSSPLDVHQADGGLLVTPPAVMAESYAGIIVQLGPSSDEHSLRVDDKVFGFTFRGREEMCHQTYITTDWYFVSRLPANVGFEEAVALSTNLVTAFNALTANFALELPWPVPEGWRSREWDTPVLVWGAASSVGMYALQVLSYWGFENVVAVARAKYHDYLRELGAKVCFDYTDEDVVERVSRYVGDAQDGRARVPYVLDNPRLYRETGDDGEEDCEAHGAGDKGSH